jgi:hypothetical protein
MVMCCPSSLRKLAKILELMVLRGLYSKSRAPLALVKTDFEPVSFHQGHFYLETILGYENNTCTTSNSHGSGDNLGLYHLDLQEIKNHIKELQTTLSGLSHSQLNPLLSQEALGFLGKMIQKS